MTVDRGVNFPSLAYGQGWRAPDPVAVKHFITDRGFPLARIPIRWCYMQPQRGGPLNPVRLKALKDTIAQCRAAGAKRIIIDFHDSGRWGDAGNNIPELVIGDTYVGIYEYIAYLTTLIPQIDGPDIEYEPNELHDMSSEAYVAFCYGFIRAVTTCRFNAKIILSAPNWSGRAAYADPHTWQMLKFMIYNWGNVTAYQLHLYFDTYGSGQVGTVDPIWLPQMQALIPKAREYGWKFAITENGCWPDATSCNAMSKLAKLVDANPDVFDCLVAFAGDYGGPTSMDPASFTSGPENPRMAAFLA